MFILLISLYIEISNFMCNLTIYETCEGKVMARWSKGLKIRELLKAHPTSSHHESPGQQNDVDTQEKQSRHRGKTVMANVWTSTRNNCRKDR